MQKHYFTACKPDVPTAILDLETPSEGIGTWKESVLEEIAAERLTQLPVLQRETPSEGIGTWKESVLEEIAAERLTQLPVLQREASTLPISPVGP